MRGVCKAVGRPLRGDVTEAEMCESSLLQSRGKVPALEGQPASSKVGCVRDRCPQVTGHQRARKGPDCAGLYK